MKNNKGFILIEVIIVLALMGIVLSMVFSSLIFSYKGFESQNKKTNIISDARAAMDYLTREIRKSNEINMSDTDGTFTIGESTYRLENRTLFKDNKEVIEGIDELIIKKNGKEINIEIIIKDNKGEDYKLSSIMNMR